MNKTIKKISILTLALILTTPQLSVFANTQQQLNNLKQQQQAAAQKLQQTKAQKQLLQSNQQQLTDFINNNIAELKNISQTLEAKKNEIGGLKSNLNSNLEQIKSLNEELVNVNAQTTVTKNKIDATNTAITNLEEKIKSHSSDLKKTLQYFQKIKGMSSVIKYLYHSKSFNGVVAQYKALSQVSTYHKDVIEKSVKENQQLQNDKVYLENLKQQLLEHSAQIMNSQTIINDKISILNNSINISEKIQDNLNFMQVDKQQKQQDSQNKLANVKSQVQQVEQVEAQQSQEVASKSFSVDVYAKELSAEEKARIDAQIASENAKRYQASQNALLAQRAAAQHIVAPVASSPQPTLQIQSRPVSTSRWIFPKTCHNLTETYGEYHPELYGSYDGGYHHAVDYACGFGTSIYAPISGKIVQINYSRGGYGTHIVFATNYGGHQYKLVIGHFSRVNVYPGQIVSVGQLLGYEGSTGNSTGPHTHFELWQDGYHVDPRNLWGY